MSLTEISVKRPAAIMMVILLLVGLGVIGYRSLGADLLPSMDIPVITITTSYNGAGSEEIKKDIVKPIEDAVAGISGIDRIHSTAREGYAQTVIIFTMKANMNSAFLDVQKAVDNAQGKLPKDADKPVLFKVDTNEFAVLTLSVTGQVSYDELYNESDKIKQSLEKTSGIGKVSLQGIEKKELIIKLDKSAMEYYGVNVNALLTKLKSDNMNLPSGQIKQDKLNESVRVIGEFKNVDEVKNLMVPTSSGGSVRLSDIGEIKLDYPESNQLVKLNGKNTIGINVQKQSDANVIEAVNNAKKELDRIKTQLPKGVTLTIADDSTTFIDSSLSEIKHNLIEGVITTALVLLLFLRSWRSSLVVLVAIPTSLISTFFMMYVFKFTLNMMSLMGLSLCIGILVDDSIVVLENIQRHLGMGKDTETAAIEGRSEIGLAAIAITLCDVVVFLPVAFMSGMVGKYFREFGITIAVAALFSLFVSFTITPMLCAKLFKNGKEKGNGKLFKKLKNTPVSKLFSNAAKFFDKATSQYKKMLIWSLENRKKVLFGVFLLICLSVALLPMKIISTEFMPQTDQSRFTIDINLTPGSNLKQTDEKVKLVENYLHTLPEVKDYYSSVGMNNNSASANIIVKLKPKDQRKKSQNQVARELRSWGKKLTGIDFIISESQMGSGNSKPISLGLRGDNADTLKKLSDEAEKLIRSIPGITDVTNSAKTNESEIKINVDRLAAMQYGVATSDIASVLRTGIQGSSAGVYRENGSNYDITVKYMDNDIKTVEDINSIKILNSSGQLIPLSQVASVFRSDSQVSITREDRQDVITISANIENVALGKVNKDITEKLKSLKLPSGYEIKFGGDQKQMAESFSALIKALAASIILVYMILVVLYESFLTPFIRMLSLPCAIIGAFGILALTGKSLNLMSMIGLIMLDGLASKNGTLLIDYTNTLMKSKGVTLREALIESGTTRLRPIIMTSLTMIVGMLPSALSLGEGSEMKSGMSLVVIGGMITSTLFSPIVLPVVYTIMDDFKKRLHNKRKKNSNIEGVQSFEA